MKQLVSLSMQSPDASFTREVELDGQKIRVIHYGCDFDLQLVASLLKKYDGEVDLFAISGLPWPIKIGKRHITYPLTSKIVAIPKKTPVVDGNRLKETYIPWSIREFVRTNGQSFQKKRVAFYSGILQRPFVSALSEYAGELHFLDPYLLMGVPKVLEGTDSLDRYTKWVAPLFKFMKLNRRGDKSKKRPLSLPLIFDQFKNADLFVMNELLINFTDTDFLKGKWVVVDSLNKKLEERLKSCGVVRVLTCLPEINGLDYLNYAIAEGLFFLCKGGKYPVTHDHVIKWIGDFNLKASIKEFVFEGTSNRVKCAFIVHPLHKDHYMKSKSLRYLSPVKEGVGTMIEKVSPLLPGFLYGSIKNIKSESTGAIVDCDIYMMFETPKAMIDEDVNRIYQKLATVCRSAHEGGARIIGLGAYTKVVGDAGVTVNELSPIPVTTGNSLSAAATLWAAKECVKKMGFIVPIKGQKRVSASAMVVGATGSIGAVTAKILSEYFTELIIMAPRAHKLIELKEEIKWLSPLCNVTATTNPDEYSDKCKLIITTTSNQGEAVLDIMKVAPGCVICDVSRPFDITKEEALKRPDVLVIANGEVELPGKTEMNCDIGLHGKVVYACLAETALLSLDGRFESFTLSRDVELESVYEIYKMAQKHGVRLAEITGPCGIITDSEIALCRQHALDKLK